MNAAGSFRAAWIAVAVSAAVAGQAAAADSADVAAGRRLALRACGECHATDRTGTSPVPDAPPFRILFRTVDPQSLPPRFKDGLMTGHTRMPMVSIDAGDLVRLTAYLQTLAPPAPRDPIR